MAKSGKSDKGLPGVVHPISTTVPEEFLEGQERRGKGPKLPRDSNSPFGSKTGTVYSIFDLDPSPLLDWPGRQMFQGRNWDKVQAAGDAVHAHFQSITSKHKLNLEEKLDVLRYMMFLTEEGATPLKGARNLPEKPHLRWEERDATQRINPVAFVRKVYGNWIGKGLTRKHLRDLDEPLYRALSVWEHRHPEDTIHELPTLAQVIDQKIERLSTEFTEEELRRLGSTLQTRLRRLKKKT